MSSSLSCCYKRVIGSRVCVCLTWNLLPVMNTEHKVRGRDEVFTMSRKPSSKNLSSPTTKTKLDPNESEFPSTLLTCTRATAVSGSWWELEEGGGNDHPGPALLCGMLRWDSGSLSLLSFILILLFLSSLWLLSS